MSLSGRENVTLADVRSFWKRLTFDRVREDAEVERWFRSLEVRPPDIEQKLWAFSGGNQQKILLAKWLRRPLKLLLLDEPTQGVDVGSKREIHQQLLELAGRGASIAISSTDVDELARLCDRVLFVHNGQIRDELTDSEITHESVALQILAQSEKTERAGA